MIISDKGQNNINGLVLLPRIVRISDSALGLGPEIEQYRTYHRVFTHASGDDALSAVGILYRTEKKHSEVVVRAPGRKVFFIAILGQASP